jgi:sortase (surface protein transpeptidase)
MNPAPRLALTALALLALTACSPAPSQTPETSSHTLQGLVAPAPQHDREQPLAAPSKRPAPPAAEPSPVPLAPTAAPATAVAEPTLGPLAPTAEPYGSQALTTPQRIVIASIALDQPLVAVGLDARNTPVVPDHDAAWYSRSASPGRGENVVVWGHALRFAGTPELPAPFERVKDARVGDTVTIVTADGAPHSYVISEQIWATPDQVRYILPTGDERLTIVNCIGDYVVDASGAVVSMTHRLITIAEPVR